MPRRVLLDGMIAWGASHFRSLVDVKVLQQYSNPEAVLCSTCFVLASLFPITFVCRFRICRERGSW